MELHKDVPHLKLVQKHLVESWSFFFYRELLPQDLKVFLLAFRFFFDFGNLLPSLGFQKVLEEGAALVTLGLLCF